METEREHRDQEHNPFPSQLDEEKNIYKLDFKFLLFPPSSPFPRLVDPLAPPPLGSKRGDYASFSSSFSFTCTISSQPSSSKKGSPQGGKGKGGEGMIDLAWRVFNRHDAQEHNAGTYNGIEVVDSLARQPSIARHGAPPPKPPHHPANHPPPLLLH